MKIVYNMIAYKSKVMQVKDDTINLFPIIQSSNEYHREDNNGSDNYSTLLSDCGHLRKTVMPENIDTRRNNIYFKQLLVPTLSPHFCYKT